MYEATTAANEILRLNSKSGHTTTPLQLIKLLYIAHGFSLALLGRPLFSEPVHDRPPSSGPDGMLVQSWPLR